MQLVGQRGQTRPRDIDLVSLQANGVRLLGRFDGLDRGRARFRPDLSDVVGAADEQLYRVLDSIDEHIAQAGLTREVWPAHRPPRLQIRRQERVLDLSRERIGTVLVAAGYRPDYPWLRLPITAADGSIRQYRGVTPAPGVYVVGQRFQHRRDSGFIDGARYDAQTVVRHLLTGSTTVGSDEQSQEPAA